jgi:hypothetical protein
MTKKMNIEDSAIVVVSDSHGIYQAQYFAGIVRHDLVTGVSDDEWEIIQAGPDDEAYWDVWADIEQNACITSPETGIKYRVWQDGDIWLVPEDCKVPENKGNQ